jgi:hypothetical protein
MTFQQYPFKGGIPSGNTAARPGSPVIGDTFYNGELEILEIWNGTQWVAVSAPPSTPQIISVTDVSTGDAYTSTAGKLAVVFQAGSGGGTPSQYNAFTVSGGHSASSSGTTVTLTGLTPGTSYEVYGNGQNNFGTTVNTPNQAAVTPTTLPQVPTIGTATAGTNAGEVTVTWTNGNNGGKNLTSITITPFLNGTTAQTSATAATTSSTSYTFTGLTQGSSYTFKVKATNANGTCADSTATNSITVPIFFTVDYLVIAGGGGGGGGYGGGGGAGGYRTSAGTSGDGASAESSLSRGTQTNYTVTIGAGGAGGINNSSESVNGANSIFSTITSTGGGGGDGTQGSAKSGGSGGGGNVTAGNGTANQGRNGGSSGAGSPNYCHGGGGGASTVGSNGTTTVGGNGGSGVSSDITGSSATRAGGGGGGTYRGGTAGSGGTGGGGNAGAASTGSAGNSGSAGSTNTGGGGGGASSGTEGYDRHGGNGGSGIVILRYPDTRTITFGAGVTGTESSASGGFKRATITAGSGNVSWS